MAQGWISYGFGMIKGMHNDGSKMIRVTLGYGWGMVEGLFRDFLRNSRIVSERLEDCFENILGWWSNEGFRNDLNVLFPTNPFPSNGKGWKNSNLFIERTEILTQIWVDRNFIAKRCFRYF